MLKIELPCVDQIRKRKEMTPQTHKLFIQEIICYHYIKKYTLKWKCIGHRPIQNSRHSTAILNAGHHENKSLPWARICVQVSSDQLVAS